MRAESPIQRIGNGFEVCEERDAAFKGREFGLGDGVEAGVF